MAKIDASSSIRTMEMWLLPYAAMFTQPSWLNAVALATGALLCLNRRRFTQVRGVAARTPPPPPRSPDPTPVSARSAN